MGEEGRIGDILIRNGLITEVELNRALDEQARTNELLGAILLKRTKLKEEDLLRVLSKQFKYPFITLKDRYIDWELVRTFSASLVLDHQCVPIQRDDWTVTVAINNPLDIWAVKKSEEEARGLKVKLVLVSKSDLADAISRYKRYIQESGL